MFGAERRFMDLPVYLLRQVRQASIGCLHGVWRVAGQMYMLYA